MPRSLSPESQRELDSLYEMLRVFADFLRPILGEDVARPLDEELERAYQARALAGLREARSDMLAMAEACSAAQRRELDAMLRARAGVPLDALMARQLARIERIRARGRIARDEQYYLVKERIEQIWDDPTRAEEFRALQDMLAAYEDRAARRRRPAPE